jgi:hypothetical protein
VPTLRHLALPLSEIAHKGTTFYPPDQNFYNLFFIGNAWINRVCRENIFMFSSDYTPYLADFHYICRYNQIYGIDHVQQVCNKINRL